MARCNECIHKEICQFYNALGCKVLCQECGFFINKADVVPKSEVEKIFEERELNRVSSLTAKFLLEDRETRYKSLMAEHDREVAREIFEEIESKIKLTLDNNCTARVENINKDCRGCPHARLIAGMVGIVDTVNGLDNIIAELKNKYTESEDKG